MLKDHLKHSYVTWVVSVIILFTVQVQARIDWSVVGGHLSIIGAMREEVFSECVHLTQYVNYYLDRNSISHQTITSEYCNPQKRSEIWYAQIDHFYPKTLLKRIEQKPQDSVCFNTALVESGILSENERSSFLANVEYFLGMNGLVGVNTSGPKPTPQYGLRNSPLVSFKKSWWISSEVRAEALWINLIHVVQNNFSPGSILCVDDSEPLLISQSLYKESRGAHCMVLVTPHLVSETNYRQPKNLISLFKAFKQAYQYLRSSPHFGRLSYYQVKTDITVKGEIVESDLDSLPEMKQLLKLAALHRDLYESDIWTSCDSAGRVDLAFAECRALNTKAFLRLKHFWQTEGAILDNPSFNKLKVSLDYNPQLGMLIELYNSLDKERHTYLDAQSFDEL